MKAAKIIGLVLLIFPVTGQLLSLPQFDAAHSTPPPEIVQSIPQLNFNMALTAVLPVLTFFPLQTIANVLLPPTSIFPQQITNGVLLWAWGTGLLTLLAVYFWNRKHKRSLDELGMPLNKATIINAFMVAVLCCEFLYIVVMAADFFFTVD